MSGPAIDYAALAEQARKTAAPPVDYAALAQQARQTSAAPPDTGFLAHAAGGLWENAKGLFNLATGADLWGKAIESAQAGKWSEAAKSFDEIAKGPAGRISQGFIDTAKGAAEKMRDAAAKAIKGDPRGALDSANAAGLHIATTLAPHIEQAAENYKQGNYGSAAGDLTADAVTALALKGAHNLPIEKGAGALGEAVKAGGKDVAVGTAKMAGGAASGLVVEKLGLPGAIATEIGIGLPLIRGGVRQLAQGLKAGYTAGKAALAAPEAAPAAPEAAPAPAQPPAIPLPVSRQLPASTTIITPNVDASGVIPGWKPTILENENPAAAPAPAAPPVPPAQLEAVAQGFGYRNYAAVKDPRAAAAIQRVAEQMQSRDNPSPGAAPPEAAPPGSPAPKSPQPAAPAAPSEAAPPAPAPAPAAPPPYGKQYITPGQASKYAAENGLTEDDAAAALDQQGVRIVDRGSTNRALHAVGGELGYDHATLSEIAHATYGKGLGKITHEQMLELTDKLANEQATLDPLKPKTPGAAAPGHSPGAVMQLATKNIQADPVRFQFKSGMGQGGAGEELRGVSKFDPEKSGILSVWKDPADGKTYVVNGHHRLELAQRTGAPEVTVRYINAADAAEARAKGALINIAEGRGTSLDAAKVFRDSGMDQAALEKEGISLKGAIAKEGLALSKLDPNLFTKVVNGDITPQRGAMIGQVAEHADQRQLVKLIEEREKSGKPMTDGQVSELLRLQAPQVTETQTSLFGDNEITRSLLAEKAAVSDYVQSRLTQKRRTFNAVGNERAATRLAAAGNVIDADKNAAIAEATSQEHAVYQKLSTSTGQISDVLDQAAKALANGENPAVIKVKAFAQIEPLLKAQADQLAGRAEGETGLESDLKDSLEAARQARAQKAENLGPPANPRKAAFEAAKRRAAQAAAAEAAANR